MKYDQIINKKFHVLQRNNILKDPERFIYNEIANRLNEGLDCITVPINKCLEIGFSSTKTYSYLVSRNKNINYSVMDISEDLLKNLDDKAKKICMDHDNWKIENNNFDIIISNFYIHLSNNFEKVLKNISGSLKKEGFFIASLPSNNFLFELKNVMLLTDLETYGGVFKRFVDNLSIQIISKLLKKNNFRDTLIDIDTIKIQYNEYNKLLKDVKNLGCSYIFEDRKKKFENKNYFIRSEEIYWEKFSRNNKLDLTLEVMYFSGWKT